MQLHRPSAVVTYHNRQDSIRGVLRALRQQGDLLERIVVIDNGSDEPLASEPGITVHRIEQAVGLSAARNVGLELVDSDLVLLLDDDVTLAPGCLQRLLDTQKETGAAVVCPRIVLNADRPVIQCDGASIHFAGMLIQRNEGASVDDVPSGRLRCTGFIGACLLVDRWLLLQLGGFDEDYFFYLEDLELSYRLAALGHSAWCESGAVVIHRRAAGDPELSYRGFGRYPPRRAYYNLRHRWLTVLMHYQVRTLLLLLPALGLYELAALGECVRRGWLPEWLEAAWSLAREGRSIRHRRSTWQRARRTPDRDILAGGALPFAAGFVSSSTAARGAHVLDSIMNRYWNWIRASL